MLVFEFAIELPMKTTIYRNRSQADQVGRVLVSANTNQPHVPTAWLELAYASRPAGQHSFASTSPCDIPQGSVLSIHEIPRLPLPLQVPPHEEYTAESAPVAALAIVLAGDGHTYDGNGRHTLRGGMSFFVPARTTVVYTSTGTEDLWVCMARSNLNYGRGAEG